MSKPKNIEQQPTKGDQAAKAQTPTTGEPGDEALEGVVGGAGNAYTVNTNRIDPYKNPKFH